MDCIKKLSGIGVATAVFVTFARSAYAQCADGMRQTDLGCLPDSPVGFVETLYTWGLGLIGMVALLFMIYGGYQILTSRGNPEAVEKGREYIMYSIIGLIMAVFGFLILQVIAGDILRIPGFSS